VERVKKKVGGEKTLGGGEKKCEIDHAKQKEMS